MIWSAFTGMVPAAFAMLLSPVPLVEFILVLLSRRARINALAFVIAVFAMTFTTPFVIGMIGDATVDRSSSSGSGAGIVMVVIALLMGALGVRNLRHPAAPPPAVLAKIDGMGPALVVGLSLGATVANPKNLVILVAAGAGAARTGLSTSELGIACLLFATVATLPYAIAAVALLAGGPAAEQRLLRVKDWLLAHNRVILGWVLIVLAVVLAAKGIGNL